MYQNNITHIHFILIPAVTHILTHTVLLTLIQHYIHETCLQHSYTLQSLTHSHLTAALNNMLASNRKCEISLNMVSLSSPFTYYWLANAWTIFGAQKFWTGVDGKNYSAWQRSSGQLATKQSYTCRTSQTHIKTLQNNQRKNSLPWIPSFIKTMLPM